MAQVTLRDKLSGTPAKFFLDSEGRVVVDRVLQALGASLVKLDDDDGGFSVLEPNHDGRSLNVFKPGQVVAIDVIPQQQPQVGSSLQQPTSLLDRLVLDADDPMMYLDCEYVHAIDLRVHVSTRVYTWPEFKSGELTTGSDPQIALVGYPPPSFLGAPEDRGWDEVYKGSTRKMHVQEIDSWLGLAADTDFGWLTQGKVGVRRVFDNTILVRSKNNEVLADLSEGVESAVLGVNIYKRLTWPAILRTHLEYLLWAVTSRLPYMQILTDMRTGGLFYACNGEARGSSVIWIVVMQDMKQVKEAFQHFGKSLPKGVRNFSQEEHVQFKNLPHRARFPYKGAKYPAVRPV